VRLAPVDGDVLLEISDDGVGAHLEAALAAPGIGLESVLERVEGRGGRAQISTAPGQGTTIRVWLPAEREDSADG
jgi:signal transduction histidine kinase